MKPKKNQPKKELSVIKRKRRKYNKIAVFAGLLCSIITGFFVLQLIDIPFGFLFNFVLFKGSVNYSIVKIHDEKYIFAQPDNSGCLES